MEACLTSLEAGRLAPPGSNGKVPSIVFDISVLDEMTSNTSSRTGVFRVVDRMALHLANRRDCRLSFSCNRQIADIDTLLKKVVGEYPELADIGPAHVWGPAITAARYGAARRKVRDLKAARRTSLSHKFRLEIARARGSVLKRKVRFNAGAFAPSDVFHSPWDPLPPHQLFSGTRCRRALTIYDMTPVLFPHFFQGAEGTLATFKSILASIAPDDHIVAISESTKRDFCEVTRHDPSRVFVTPLAADERMFMVVRDSARIAGVRARYGIPEGRYVLSVNTLQPRKNIDHVVRAFVQLVKEERIRDLSLVLVGDRGWKTGTIDEALRAAGLSERQIIVTGYVPDSDLAPLYSDALAFIYVSHYEGFGLPALEAMQCGVPVIASNNSSIPEVVGDAGLMISPVDREALCGSILSFHRKPSLRADYAARAAQRAKQFSWPKCTDLTVAAYRHMLDGTSASSGC